MCLILGLHIATQNRSRSCANCETASGYFISSMICFSSAGISGIGSGTTCILPSAPLADDHVDLGEAPALLLGIVVAELAAAALLAQQAGPGDRLGDGQQVVQVEGGVPAGVVLAVADRADLARPAA